MKHVRSIVGVLAGLLLISLIAEGIEFALVTALRGGSTQPDAVAYFAVRNQPGVLALKLVYNNVAALAGGYVAAWVAGRMAVLHGLLLAIVQAAGLVYGMTVSGYADFTPTWMWFALLVTMPPAVVLGSSLRAKRTPGTRAG